MNKGLQESADKYDLHDILSDRGVYPISLMDAKIIQKLTSILINMEGSEELVNALKSWKNSPDEDVLSMLEEVELNTEQDVDGVMKKTIDFVNYEGKTLAVRTLFSIEKENSYDTKRAIPVFKVLINKSENVNVLNANKEFIFDDDVDRDLSIEDLQQKLSQFTNIRFL